MNSKLSLIAIAIIGLMFLSMPAGAAYLSHLKSGELGVSSTDLATCGKDSAYAFSQSDDSIVDASRLRVPVNPLDTVGAPACVGLTTWMDLGANYRITSVSIYNTPPSDFTVARTLKVWGSNTSSSSGFIQLIDLGNFGNGWKNSSISIGGQYRYIRFSTGVDSISAHISEVQFFGNPAPTITGWGNSFTGNSSLNIAPPAGQNVIFSIQTTDQVPDYYIWTVDNVNQSNNFSSIVLSFNTLQHVVNATISNANGTSAPVSWVINGAAYQLPSAPVIPSGAQCAVMFDKSTQSINSIGYVLTNVDYGFLDFNSYRTEVYSTKLPLLYSFQMDKSNATEIFTISYPLPDVYTAQVVKSFPLLGDSVICTNTNRPPGKVYDTF